MSGRAVVLGAAGFIGRHACRRLARRGLQVTGIGHGEWAGTSPADWGIAHWHAAEIDVDSLGRWCGDGADVYLQCAGGSAVAQSYASPLDDFHRSVSTTAAVLEHVRRHGAKARVVLTSSAAVYGDQGDVDLTETSVRAPVSPYGFNKQAAENVCDSYARFFGVGVSVVRLFSVYGEGLRKQLLWDASNKLLRGEAEFFGTGHELRDWIHVEDAAELLCAAALNRLSHYEVFNGGHTHASTREVLQALARALDVELAPRFSGQAHSGNPRRLTAECAHARRQLGWAPEVPLDDGLARYARWFLAQRGSAAGRAA